MKINETIRRKAALYSDDPPKVSSEIGGRNNKPTANTKHNMQLENSSGKLVEAMNDSSGQYTEERVIYGSLSTTPELHDKRYDGADASCHKVGDGKWCFKSTMLSIDTPNNKWVFVGTPTVECVRNNDDSCGWNMLGSPDRTFIRVNNPHHIEVEVLTNSRSIDVRLACNARYYPG